MRRTLERSSSGNDDSYLLWVIRFFLEFNRLDGFKLPLVRWVLSVCPCQGSYLNFVLLISNNCSLSFVWCVCLRLNSEALSSTNYHWVLGRIQHHLDMLTSDKKNAKLWERRLNIAIQVRKSRILSRIVWMNDKWKIIVNVSFVCLPFRRWRSSFKISLHCKRCRVKMHSHYSKCCCIMCATFWNSVKLCSTHWRATMKIATQSNSTPQRTSIQFVWFYPPSPSPSLFFPMNSIDSTISTCCLFVFVYLFLTLTLFLCAYFPIKTDCTCEMWLKLLTFSLNWWNDFVMAVLLFKINKNRARKTSEHRKNHQNGMHKQATMLNA